MNNTNVVEVKEKDIFTIFKFQIRNQYNIWTKYCEFLHLKSNFGSLT
jgi:hypothetical protein